MKNLMMDTPLTITSLMEHAERNFPTREIVSVSSDNPSFRYTYSEAFTRTRKLANALNSLGISLGDHVGTLAWNDHRHFELYYAISCSGAVCHTVNPRLFPEQLVYIINHAEDQVIFCDPMFVPILENIQDQLTTTKHFIVLTSEEQMPESTLPGLLCYETLLAQESSEFDWPELDEKTPCSMCYTSGTTGRPKGVVYHHRGAYLMTMGTPISWRMTLQPVFMAIVPLFHCNGWNHTWMMPLLGGTVVGCRDISAKAIYDGIADERVSHFGGAPIVLNMIVNAEDGERRNFDHQVEVFTAGAPPAPATLAAIGQLGFNVTQVYGLTETYGHVVESLWNPDWDTLPAEEQSSRKARQGIAMPMMDLTTVVDDTGQQIAMDGVTQGEIVMRGNSVMKGYYKNPEATEKAFSGGFFHSEDIAIQHPDGMMQIADRMKDIIISGGENISSIEIEGAIMAHPAVSLCAVVAKPDDKWGEVPCAFVELLEGKLATEAEVIAFVRGRLAGFKTPKRIIFQELPKTSTGKIQKFELRDIAKTA